MTRLITACIMYIVIYMVGLESWAGGLIDLPTDPPPYSPATNNRCGKIGY